MTAPRFEFDVPVNGTTLHLRLRMLRWQATAWCLSEDAPTAFECMESRLLDTLDHGEEDDVWVDFDNIITAPASYLPICRLERENADRLLPMGRLFARCPHCGTERELSLEDLATILGPALPPIFSGDEVFLRTPMIADLFAPPKRPDAAIYASQLRFELPTKRAGYEMGTIEGGILSTLDEVRYEQVIAEWAERAATIAPTPHWWSAHNETFRATIKLLVGTDMSLGTDPSPQSIGALAAVDGYFLDALYWYTHFVDVPESSTTTCTSCHERFVPAAQTPIIAKPAPPPPPRRPPPPPRDLSPAIAVARSIAAAPPDASPELRVPVLLEVQRDGQTKDLALELQPWSVIAFAALEIERNYHPDPGIFGSLSIDGQLLSGPRLDAVLADAQLAGRVLYERYQLYQRLRGLGRLFAQCPHCRAEEIELSLLGMFNNLGALPPPMLTEDFAYFCAPALARSWFPPARPERFAYASRLRFELPSRRAGLDAVGFTSGVLQPIDTARHRVLFARWADDTVSVDEPPERRWFKSWNATFRATINMIVGTSDLEPSIDATPETLGEMAAVDLYFLDAIYWYTHFVDVKEHAPPRTCPRCRGAFMPVARWAYV